MGCKAQAAARRFCPAHRCFPAYDEQPGPSSDDLIRVPDYPNVALTTWQMTANGLLL